MSLRRSNWRILAVGALAAAALTGCASPPATPQLGPTTAVDTRSILPGTPWRSLVSAQFDVGAAVSWTRQQDLLDDPAYAAVIAGNFTSVTPENQLKWSVVHPEADTWDFGPADRLVDFAAAHGQKVRGHALLWHGSLPSWVRDAGRSCDTLRPILQQHITELVGHYKGRIAEWDVANEVVDADGRLRKENPFLSACGESIIGDAFRWAHDADPSAKLYVNDYALPYDGSKLTRYLRLVPTLVQAGAPIDGFGVQGHETLDPKAPTAMRATLTRLAELDLDLRITEADVRMDTVQAQDEEALRLQAQIYGGLVSACLEQSRCVGFTVWGVRDGPSWVSQTWPEQGNETVMTSSYQPKPAYAAVTSSLKAHRR